jgi:peptidoglycan/LPS O-acetylase OafA/YrhL
MTADAVDSRVENSSPPHVRPRFRPDIEGLRAIAVGLVLGFHGYREPFTGGFIGVDVFFVISGFLITSLLLREQVKTGQISILGFYARRVRRILPASALVVVVTIVATYLLLGFIAGNATADDAKWTAVFAANIHFGLLGTDYLGSQLPPSPLQHMWSLGVEEQFYVVWPGLFLFLVLLVRGARHRWALGAVLVAVIVSSLTWSLVQTTTNATWAYFSPLTRAWELGLGALIAVGAVGLGRVTSRWLTETVAALGLVFIAAGALLFDDTTPFPGSAVALPVVGTGLVIAAGCANECTVVGRMLSVRPMQWVGARSYSLYLWHWPLLIIAAQYLGDDLTMVQATGMLVAATIASALTYRLLENPVRRSRYLAPRTGLTLAMGAALIAGQVCVAQGFVATHYGTWNPLQASIITEGT